jgi:hypothetical protein
MVGKQVGTQEPRTDGFSGQMGSERAYMTNRRLIKTAVPITSGRGESAPSRSNAAICAAPVKARSENDTR